MSPKANLLACAAAFCAAAAALAGPPGDKQKPAAPDARAMVEALANRNPAPLFDSRERAVFPKNYDSAEYARAARVPRAYRARGRRLAGNGQASQ
ncbi:MAG: hypothetical protein ABSF26_19730 [Thermoguttaceae bacterium]|jgi:hypothetical protein